LLLSARDALTTMATPLLPPSASSAMSAAAASATRARAVAAKSRDGSAQRNLGLSRPRHLLSAGASPPVCLSFAGWLLRRLLSCASASHHLSSRSCLTHPDNSNRPSIRCIRSCNHPQRTCGISRRAHCHHRCTRKNCHVNNKYKMELIYYPAPHRERRAADDGNTAVAAISVVCNERGCSLSREGQGGRRQVP
jgi:hypothetical protein